MAAQLKLVEPELTAEALVALLLHRINSGDFLNPVSMIKRQCERELRAHGFSRKQVKTIVSVVGTVILDGIPDV